MVFLVTGFLQFPLQGGYISLLITLAILIVNTNALTWSKWKKCPGSLCGKSRVASCLTNGIDDLGIRCVKQEEPFVEKLYDCSAICTTWTNEKLKRSCSGNCYLATMEYSADCQTEQGCRKVDSRRCYDQTRCNGKWIPAGPMSACSATCGGGKQTQTEQCKRNTLLITSCVGSGGTATTRSVTKDCNTNACPAWTKWSPWSLCDISCMKKRSRTCSYNNAASTACGSSSSTQTENAECKTFACVTTTATITKSTTTTTTTQPPKTVSISPKTTTSTSTIKITPKTSTKTTSTTPKTSSTKKTSTIKVKSLSIVPCDVGMRCTSWTDWTVLRDCNASCKSDASGQVMKTRTCTERISNCNQMIETKFETCEHNPSCQIGTGGVSIYLIVIIILVTLFIIFIIVILCNKRRNRRKKRKQKLDIQLTQERPYATIEQSDLVQEGSQTATTRRTDQEENEYVVML